MERKEQSPMLSGWVGGGARERSEGAIGTVVVPLADVVPSDIGSSDAFDPSDDGSRDSHAEEAGRVWRWVITVEGTCMRASTTPTDRRRDALLSATRFVEAAKRIVRSEPGRVTGTIAHAIRRDGMPNGSDGQFVLHLELRDADPASIGRVYERVAAEAWTIGRLSQTRLVLTPHESNPSVLYDVRPQTVAASPPSFSLSGQRNSPAGPEVAVHEQGLRTG